MRNVNDKYWNECPTIEQVNFLPRIFDRNSPKNIRYIDFGENTLFLYPIAIYCIFTCFVFANNSLY